jgi:peptide/nickel transport system substrate-binding protein
MRRTASLFLAVSLLLAGAEAATRPHYGGTLHVTMQSSPNALEMPGNATPREYWDASRVLALFSDTLVKVDAQGRPASALAIAWQHDANSRHWELTLRPAVKFHDGSALSPAAVAQVLASLHPEWTIRATQDGLTIGSESPMPFLPAELALPRNAILKRAANGAPIGTGPFRMAEFQPGHSMKLVASDDAWAGRPFVDAVEVDFGRSLRDQAIAFELHKTDVIEAAPTAGSSQQSETSFPIELLALVFPSTTRAQDPRVREALALSIDRKPIQSVLLKGAGEPSASVLPNWMTGYSAAFPAQPNLQRARAVLSEVKVPPLTLSYDPRDGQAQLIAERIALNAKEAGINMQVSLSGADDLRLVRVVLPSPDPGLTMREAARELGLPQPVIHSNAVEDLFQAEKIVIDGNAVIPLFHLPVGAAAATNVRGWEPDRMGGWNLAAVWLEGR